MRKILIAVVAFEALRLVCWVLLLVYVTVLLEPAAGLEHEGFIFVHMVALYLGFPYVWLDLLIPAGLAELIKSNYRETAWTLFVLWALGAGASICLLKAWVRRNAAGRLSDQPRED